MITLKDLFQQISWQEVFKSLQKYYSDDLENNCEAFQYAFEEICELTPENNDDGMILKIRYIKGMINNNDTEYYYYDVSGFVNDEHYGLDFSSWSSWLGLYVDEKLFEQFSYADIITHSLWEMTFHGFSEGLIQDKKDKLIKRVEEAKNNNIEWLKTSEIVKNCFK